MGIKLLINGAKVVREYDEKTVTHILSDFGKGSENFVASRLGYKSINDVPHDKPIVKYEWVEECFKVRPIMIPKTPIALFG